MGSLGTLVQSINSSITYLLVRKGSTVKALRCLHAAPGQLSHWGVFSTLERITAWNFGAGSWVDWIMFVEHAHKGREHRWAAELDL